MRTAGVLLGLVATLPSARAEATAYFAPQPELLRSSEVIALVEVTQVRELEPEKNCGTQRATATVVRTLRGTTGEKLTFLVPCFFPCAITKVQKGQQLVFLRRARKGGELQGASWYYSYRLVHADHLEWYADNYSLKLVRRPLAAVLASLEAKLRPRAARPRR